MNLKQLHVESRQFSATSDAFNLPHPTWIWRFCWGWPPFEFCWDLWHQKTRVPGLSCLRDPVFSRFW